jgi:hypothetical protein
LIIWGLGIPCIAWLFIY